MSVTARFIGGPLDGQLIAIFKAIPFYEVAEHGDINSWVLPESPCKPIEIRTVRYQLYDTWPVKYLFEDDWGGTRDGER